MQITGAELFVKALLAEQVDTIFAYPGGQAIDLLLFSHVTNRDLSMLPMGMHVLLVKWEFVLLQVAPVQPIL